MFKGWRRKSKVSGGGILARLGLPSFRVVGFTSRQPACRFRAEADSQPTVGKCDMMGSDCFLQEIPIKSYLPELNKMINIPNSGPLRLFADSLDIRLRGCDV